jgi:uncharacterized DUF497 family protein
MAFEFQWDADKAAANVRKHGVTFSEAATAFRDPLSATIEDAAHSGEEQRYVLFGMSERGRLLAVMHTERDEVIRIISARKATRAEQKEYEDEEL